MPLHIDVTVQPREEDRVAPLTGSTFDPMSRSPVVDVPRVFLLKALRIEERPDLPTCIELMEDGTQDIRSPFAIISREDTDNATDTYIMASIPVSGIYLSESMSRLPCLDRTNCFSLLSWASRLKNRFEMGSLKVIAYDCHIQYHDGALHMRTKKAVIVSDMELRDYVTTEVAPPIHDSA